VEQTEMPGDKRDGIMSSRTNSENATHRVFKKGENNEDLQKDRHHGGSVIYSGNSLEFAREYTYRK
jgi:hypothetical protein